jgi:hypothetical protein
VNLRNAVAFRLVSAFLCRKNACVTTEPFVPLHILSRRTGLPEAWLKAEAIAGRIPSLRAGRRLMFNAVVVMGVLTERSKSRSTGAEGHDTGEKNSN